MTYSCFLHLAWIVGFVIAIPDPDFALADVTSTDRQFELPSVEGNLVEVKRDQSLLTVVCFLGNECPLARLYAKRLNALQGRFDGQVVIVGVNSNQQDSMQELKQFHGELGLQFAMVKDYKNRVADQYGASRTAEVFVLDSKLEVQYHGRIDDQYSPGIVRSKATKFYLRDALEQLLAGKPVAITQTEPVGCLIGRSKQPVSEPTVTFTNQVSRLIQKQCIECHRKNEIGPFDMSDYDEVKGWAEMIVEVVDNGRMPPWHATNKHIRYSNERIMSENEKQVFRDWLAQGTPYGSASELPEPRSFTTGWRLPRTPDKVVAMRARPFVVPATGTVEYQYFVVDPGFEKETWVTAAEVVPGNRAVVHHSIVFVRPPDGTPFRGIGWLAAYVPGQGNPPYNPSHARLVPAGSKFVFQQHYTPVGTEQTDVTQIGLVFGKQEELTHEVFTLAALDQGFEIPPQKSDHFVATSLEGFPSDGKLISFAPHMHYRGKAFQLFLTSNGKEQQLIDITAYDFNWQHNYELVEPIDLTDVENLKCQFSFDNSEGNLFNPDPLQTVTWGDQTWEEMAVAFFQIARPIGSDPATNMRRKKQVDHVDVSQFVDDYFEKFDKNRDDVLVRDELPRAIRQFRFRTYDTDGDSKLSRTEMRNAASDRQNK